MAGAQETVPPRGRLDAPVFWVVVMGFFALLPFFGTWVAWLPTATWLASTGQVSKALSLAAIGAGFVGGIDNVLRPALLAGHARMNGACGCSLACLAASASSDCSGSYLARWSCHLLRACSKPT